jgi:hypothetical protein
MYFVSLAVCNIISSVLLFLKNKYGWWMTIIANIIFAAIAMLNWPYSLSVLFAPPFVVFIAVFYILPLVLILLDGYNFWGMISSLKNL